MCAHSHQPVGNVDTQCVRVCSVMSDSLRPHGLSPPGSSVHGILQARILEWVFMLSSRGSSQPRDQTPCLLHLLHWQADSSPLCHQRSPWTPREVINFSKIMWLIRNSAPGLRSDWPDTKTQQDLRFDIINRFHPVF